MAVRDSRALYDMLRTNKSKAPRAEENENLHKEYIYNLQQQIHYLELENKYLRSKTARASTPVERPLSDSKEEAVKDALSSEDLPTNEKDAKEHVQLLKRRVIQLEHNHKIAREALESEIDKLQKKIQYQEYIIQQWKTEKAEDQARHDRALAQCTKEKERLVTEIVTLSKELEANKKTKERAEAERRQIFDEKEKLKEANAGLAGEIRRLRALLEEAELERESLAKRMESAENELADLRRRNDEAKDIVKRAQEDIKRAEQDAASTAEQYRAVELRCKQLEVQLTAEHAARDKVDEQLRLLVEQNVMLTDSLERQKQQVQTALARAEQLVAEKDELRRETVRLEQRTKSLEEDCLMSRDSMELQRRAAASLTEQLHAAQQQIFALTSERDDLLHRLEKNELDFREVDGQNTTLRKENRMLFEQLERGRRDLAEKEATLENLTCEIATIRAAYEHLRAKLAMLRDDADVEPASEVPAKKSRVSAGTASFENAAVKSDATIKKK